MINVENNYKNEVLGIWKKFRDHDIFSDPNFEYRKYPLLPKTVDKHSLLFVGMNPSYKKGSVISENEKPIGFYPKKLEGKDIPYFEKIKNVAEYCQTDWTHLDLFFIRETNQKVIEGLSRDKKGIEFLEAQLNIFFEIVEKSNPKLIIVSNAFASEFFGKKKVKHKRFDKIWKGYDLYFKNNIWNKESTFNSRIGTYEIKLGGKNIPIIFSGMLSGQRALDIGSFERLKWQAKMILEIEK